MMMMDNDDYYYIIFTNENMENRDLGTFLHVVKFDTLLVWLYTLNH